MLFLIILVLTIASSFFLPWWTLTMIAFGAAYFFGKKPGQGFFSGFAAIFVAWTILALIQTLPNNNILADRVAKLMQLHNWVFLLLATGLVGGLVGGMSALSGELIRKAFTKP